jgi:hypothetical protein
MRGGVAGAAVVAVVSIRARHSCRAMPFVAKFLPTNGFLEVGREPVVNTLAKSQLKANF